MSSNNSIEVGNARAPSLRLRAPASKPKALIAEDHEDTREMLRVILEQHGWRVIEATDGMEAVKLAASEQPDLILMDGSLPLFDGIEATRLIRAFLSQVFIIALNGWGTANFHAEALAAGCNDCLAKPIDFERLEGHLVPFLERSVI